MMSFPEAQASFEKRYEPFISEAGRLESLAKKMFGREEIKKTTSADELVFVLTRASVDDFNEVYILVANGLSIGALKIVRSLYEHVVTACYIADVPAAAQDFIDYDAIHKYKLLNRLPEDLRTRLLTAERIAEVRTDYERVKPKFEKEACSCGKKRLLSSWTTLDMPSLAAKVGRGLFELYGPAFLFPTLYLHTSLVDVSGRVASSNGTTELIGGQNRFIGEALIATHRLLLAALSLHDPHFSLGLGNEVGEAIDGFNKCWEQMRVRDSTGKET